MFSRTAAQTRPAGRTVLHVGLAINSMLSQELEELYPELVAPDRPLGIACRCAVACWGEREDPHRTRGTIFPPWVGAGYRRGGVCVVGLNLRIGAGNGTYWDIERNVAEHQHEALVAGRMRSKGSRWARATMRDAAIVLRHLGGDTLDEPIGPAELAETLERTSRIQTVKCSPGTGRGAPLKPMMANCPPIYLARELAVLRPGVLLVYGSAAGAAVRRIGSESAVERPAKRFRRMAIRFEGWSCVAFMLTHPAHGGWLTDHHLLRASLTRSSLANP